MTEDKRAGFTFHIAMIDDETGEEVTPYTISYKHLPYGVYMTQVVPLAVKSMHDFVDGMVEFGLNEYLEKSKEPTK